MLRVRLAKLCTIAAVAAALIHSSFVLAQAPQNQNTRGRAPANPGRLQQPRQPIRVANQPGPGGNAGGAPAQPQQPIAPFGLTPDQQTSLNGLLATWEKQSDQVNTFKCHFLRWDYDPVFGPNGGRDPKSVASGEIKYKAPDHGVYRVIEMAAWNTQKKAMQPVTDSLDHWVCNGKSIYEFAHVKKQLIERQIPPDLQGKAITDGPIPFIFGAKADKLKQRYFLRQVNPPESIKGAISLEAFPRFQRDAANFHHAELILTEPDFLPYALQIYMPDGKTRTVYQFDKRKVNDLLAFLDFRAPSTPLGWQKIVVPADRPEPPGTTQTRQAASARAGSVKK